MNVILAVTHQGKFETLAVGETLISSNDVMRWEHMQER
jgi:hypothetical protein